MAQGNGDRMVNLFRWVFRRRPINVECECGHMKCFHLWLWGCNLCGCEHYIANQAKAEVSELERMARW